MIVERNESQSQTMALRSKLAGYSVRGLGPSGYPCASGLLDSLWGAVSSMEGLPLAHRTKEGLARLTEARTKHGKFTKEKRAEARRFAKDGRQMRGELKELEAWFVDRGHLSKDWRKDWKL